MFYCEKVIREECESATVVFWNWTVKLYVYEEAGFYLVIPILRTLKAPTSRLYPAPSGTPSSR